VIDTRSIDHLSLCSGIGGIDLGLRAVVNGCRTIAYVEREAFCINHLVAQMEEGRLDSAPIYTDIHRFPWGHYRGLVDILSGGVPCQPFSHNGSRHGVKDPRHLWPSVREGIDIIRPAIVFLENVGGFATAKSDGYFSVLHHVCSDLERLGYTATAGLFTAGELGASQMRKRWFILAMAHPHHSGGRQNQLLCQLRAEGTEQSPRDTGDSPAREEEEVTRWPSGPDAPQHSWEKPRVTEPRLGGTTDGVSARIHKLRTDRLRSLGNAVVPAVAALAFATLFEELVL